MFVLPCMMKRGVGEVVTDLEMEALPWIVWSGFGDSHRLTGRVLSEKGTEHLMLRSRL